MIGLDASNVNTEVLFRLQLPKVDFAILKATEGLTFTDLTHGPRAAEVRAAGKLCGHYHFDRSNDDGAQQAAFFLSVAKPLPGETLWLDMETEDAQSWGTVATRAATFLRAVYATTGAVCGLYSDRSELVAVLAAATPNDRTVLDGAPLWFADPDHPAGRPLAPKPWAIHQYGSAGGLDVNVTSQNFTWAAMAVPANPPAQPDPKESAVLLFQDPTGIYFLTGAGTVHVPTEPDVAVMRAAGVPFANPLSAAFGASLRGTTP